MRKMNNKGFVLAETLIVTVFLMIIFSMIYSNFYPLIGEYEKRETYDDVDSVYSVYWLKRLIEDPSYKAVDSGENKGYIRFRCSDVTGDNKKTCVNLVNAMNVSCRDENGDNCDIFITNYNTSDFKKTVEDERNNFSSDFQDYVFNLPEYTKKSKNDAQYRVIARFKHTDDYYSYSTIEVSANLNINLDITYSIEYDLDGGINHEENPSTYTGKTEISLKSPTKEGYDFSGWTGTYLEVETEPVTIPKGSTGNRFYKAHWEVGTFMVNYNCNGGEGNISSQEIKYNSKYTITSDTCTRLGYKQIGWNREADGSGEMWTESNRTEWTWTIPDNVTLYATWKSIKPATPTFTDSGKAGTWTNQNFSMSLITKTEEDIIGNWYYRYPNNEDKTYHKYTNDNCKSNICTTTDFSAERHEPVEIIVCNKWAEDIDGKTELDIYNCSDPASETILIDKTPPRAPLNIQIKDNTHEYTFAAVDCYVKDHCSGIGYIQLAYGPIWQVGYKYPDVNSPHKYNLGGFPVASEYLTTGGIGVWYKYEAICDFVGNCVPNPQDYSAEYYWH